MLGEELSQIQESWSLEVPLEDDPAGFVHWPINLEIGVVPGQSHGKFWRVGRAEFEDHLSVVFERTIAMGKTFGNKDLVPGGRAEFYLQVSAERGGASAKVDHDVQNAAAGYLHELGLAVRRELVVKSQDRFGFG